MGSRQHAGLQTVERLLVAGDRPIDDTLRNLLSSRIIDHAPAEQQSFKREGTVAGLLDSALTGFFRSAARGVAFTAEDGIKRRYGESLQENYPEASASFLRFATSFWTLRLVLTDEPQEWRETLAGYLLGNVELTVAGTFFPTRTKWAVQKVAERERVQRQVLRNFAELYDVEEFMRGNPILLRDKRQHGAGCLSVIVLMPLGLWHTLSPP